MREPCPFCGGTVDIKNIKFGVETGTFRGECEMCGATGPSAFYRVGAEEAWDKREEATP